MATLLTIICEMNVYCLLSWKKGDRIRAAI